MMNKRFLTNKLKPTRSKKLAIANRVLNAFGMHPRQAYNGLKGFFPYLKDYYRFTQQLRQASPSHVDKMGSIYLCLGDRFDNAGQASGHYFHQDLMVAQSIFLRRPLKHVDIGSRIDGFVAHVASFREIEMLDIRPNHDDIANMKFSQLDLMNDLDDQYVDYCDSLSCLHALEHFGLGRYGDDINTEGHLIGFKNMCRIIKPGGAFYLSVPIGSNRIEFNAHRVFSLKSLFALVGDSFEVVSLSIVDDKGDLHKNIPITDSIIDNSFGCWYGCGILDLRKL